jgi:hypothetical protein
MKAIRAIATIVTLLILLGSTQAAQASCCPIMLFTPDIKITDAHVVNSTIPNKKIIAFTVKNVGAKNAGPFTIRVTDNKTAFIQTISYDIGGLAINQSYDFVLDTWEYCPERTIFADSANVVFEVDETNNTAIAKSYLASGNIPCR